MRSISSAIIVTAGMLCFTAGAFVAHNDTQMFVMLVGAVVAIAGFAGWAREMLKTGTDLH